jgi:hypothetical protein
MNTEKLSNISLESFRCFLIKYGCEKKEAAGGHEKWEKEGLEHSP